MKCTRARAQAVALTTTGTMLAASMLASCSLSGGESSEASGTDDGGTPTEVVLVTHESFALPEELTQQFEADTGLTLKVRASGDAGALTNKLVLTKDSPTGDVAFGVDNTFASRAIDEGVFASYAPTLPEGAEALELEGDDEDALTPVDSGNVCVNVDDTWFADHDLAPPATLDDLKDPAYADLLVVPGATTSSPGMAFLLATIAAYGDGWPDYWADLMDNGAKLTDGWSDAYQVDFTQGGGKGDRPIVVSYDSSPAFTVDGKGGTTTSALLDTCFEQVEYAGVLAGAANPEGAEQVVDWLLSNEVQAALPDSMYVYPAASDAPLPADWAQFAPRPSTPYDVDPASITEHRDDWLTEWSDVTSR